MYYKDILKAFRRDVHEYIVGNTVKLETTYNYKLRDWVNCGVSDSGIWHNIKADAKIEK